MAVTCVKVIPPGTQLGMKGSPNAAVLVYPFITVDDTCSSGMVILSKNDLKLTVAPEPIDSVRVADMYEVFLAFMAVFATVWGFKRIYRLFTGDMERD